MDDLFRIRRVLSDPVRDAVQARSVSPHQELARLGVALTKAWNDAVLCRPHPRQGWCRLETAGAESARPEGPGESMLRCRAGQWLSSIQSTSALASIATRGRLAFSPDRVGRSPPAPVPQSALAMRARCSTDRQAPLPQTILPPDGTATCPTLSSRPASHARTARQRWEVRERARSRPSRSWCRTPSVATLALSHQGLCRKGDFREIDLHVGCLVKVVGEDV